MSLYAWKSPHLEGRFTSRTAVATTFLKELDDGDGPPCIVDVFEIAVLESSSEFKGYAQRLLC
jgi:hypothetical protein